MNFWENFWDFLWFLFWCYAFIAFLGVLFSVVGDLFRDKGLNGWFKALWLVVMIFLPFLGILAYLIARGDGMAERNQRQSSVRQEAQASYIRSMASVSVSDEISKARALLDAGNITAEEYALIKEQALTG